MSVLQFPDIGYFKLADNTVSNFIECGYFNLSEGIELQYMLLSVFQRGVIVTPYTVRMNVYGTDALESPIFSSSWETLSMSTLTLDEAGTHYSNNFYGNIYLTFAGNPLNPNIDYYMALELSGYTRVADTYYFAAQLDWSSPVNIQTTSHKSGARVRIIGKK